MKKLLCVLLIFVVMLGAAACNGAAAGSQETTPPIVDPLEGQTGSQQTAETEGTVPTENPVVETQPQKPYVFAHNGIEIAMNAPASDIIAALGEPKSYTEEASCAFEGMDKTYYYGSFYLQTYPLEGKDYVYCLWIVDDTITTPEGLYIGAAQAQVEQLYGSEGFNGANAYVIEQGDCVLTIIVDNGVVSSIQYDALVL